MDKPLLKAHVTGLSYRQLEDQNKRLREALQRMTQYAADAVMVPLYECNGEPFKTARAILAETEES